MFSRGSAAAPPRSFLAPRTVVAPGGDSVGHLPVGLFLVSSFRPCVRPYTKRHTALITVAFDMCLPNQSFFLKIVLAVTDLLCCPVSVRIGLSVSAKTSRCPRVRRALRKESLSLGQWLRSTGGRLLLHACVLRSRPQQAAVFIPGSRPLLLNFFLSAA